LDKLPKKILSKRPGGDTREEKKGEPPGAGQKI